MTIETKKVRTITSAVVGDVIKFTVIGGGELELDTSELHQDIRAKAMFHGLVQRISDAAALSRDTETGRPASPQEKFDAMQQLVAHYMTGTADWNVARSSTSGGNTSGLLFRALMALYPQAGEAKIREKIKGWTKVERVAVEQGEKVKALMDSYRAEAAKGVDAEELLGDLV